MEQERDGGLSAAAAPIQTNRSDSLNGLKISSARAAHKLVELPAMARVAMSDPSLDKQCEGDQSKISKRVAGNAVFQNKSASDTSG